jgi:hypothetical protein
MYVCVCFCGGWSTSLPVTKDETHMPLFIEQDCWKASKIAQSKHMKEPADGRAILYFINYCSLNFIQWYHCDRPPFQFGKFISL